MNTPAHAILNLLVFKRSQEHNAPILIGALLPDSPMFIFYFVEKFIRNMPENTIWAHAYYNPHWQDFFDIFNSFPIIGLLFVIALWIKNNWLQLLCKSMALHCIFDLPLHHDDGHRHFFPLTHWRFSSPISYWDPNHYGQIFGLFEAALVIIGSVILFRIHTSKVWRVSIAILIMIYIAYLIFALFFWSDLVA
ncbi:MAG: hypothetical protein HOH77_02655 [Candidatus Latescibacteria bacterium]|jgi:hypothetical protein|nr:hypothetical protein [Candidatus Latescibacterota bacterium]